MKYTKNGYATLYILLIIASVTVSNSLAAAVGSTFSGTRLRAYALGAEIRTLTSRCVETLLMQVRNNTSLTGAGTIIIGTGSCNYIISGSVPVKIIAITATKNNLYKRVNITITQVSPVLLINWTEGT